MLQSQCNASTPLKHTCTLGGPYYAWGRFRKALACNTPLLQCCMHKVRDIEAGESLTCCSRLSCRSCCCCAASRMCSRFLQVHASQWVMSSQAHQSARRRLGCKNADCILCLSSQCRCKGSLVLPNRRHLVAQPAHALSLLMGT
jgi:hypothetical protein